MPTIGALTRMKRLYLNPLRQKGWYNPRGRKEMYLPDFTLTLLHTPNQPPNMASFLVPLWFNKLDMKDYLYHVYDIGVTNVRSFVLQNKLETLPGNQKKRKRSTKKMTVEMVRVEKTEEEEPIVWPLPRPWPFAWPEMPDNKDAWEKDMLQKVLQERKKNEMKFRPDYAEQPKEDAQSIASKAKALLSGETRWKPASQDFSKVQTIDT